MINFDGKDYVVSPEFEACVRRVLGTMTFNTADVESERMVLMRESNDRYLDEHEIERLDYLTHVKNVANTIRVVGAHHDPAEFGLDGWDAVHGNAHHADCGCVKHFVFDHHSVTNHFGHNRVSKTRDHHYIEPRRVCKAHKHLAADPKAHAAALCG